MTAFAAAAGALLGSLVVIPAPWRVAIAVASIATRSRRPISVLLALIALTSFMASRAEAGMAPVQSGEFDGWATLVDDPTPLGNSGVRFTVRIDSRRIDASAHGSVGYAMTDRLAGERVWLRGRLSPIGPDDSWSRWRHVVGRLTVSEVVADAPAAPVGRFVNQVRRTLSTGSRALPANDRALFLGMVIGDDRGQFPATADDFRAAGLGHLLVVSGQNVAFVLAIVAPMVSRLRPGSRLVILMLLLTMFSLLTRFEPSVLRAVVMAGVSVGATALDLNVDGRKALSWAITALLVIDPFLIHVIGFQLSVAATAGLVLFSGPIASRLRGPMLLRVALATTVSAQIAVSPVLIATFGPMPLMSLPANVLAEPVAGPVMMWGSTAGLLAGVMGGWVAHLIHLPTRVFLWWISGVAGVAARSPAVMVGGLGIAVLAFGLAALLSKLPTVKLLGAMTLVAVVALASAGAPSIRSGRTDVGEGAVVWHAGTSTLVVLDRPRDPRRTLEALRLHGVRSVDAVVALRGNRSDADAVRAIRDRYGSIEVAAPPLHRVRGAHGVHSGEVMSLTDLSVEIMSVDPRIEVRVSIDADIASTSLAVAEGGYGR